MAIVTKECVLLVATYFLKPLALLFF